MLASKLYWCIYTEKCFCSFLMVKPLMLWGCTWSLVFFHCNVKHSVFNTLHTRCLGWPHLHELQAAPLCLQPYTLQLMWKQQSETQSTFEGQEKPAVTALLVLEFALLQKYRRSFQIWLCKPRTRDGFKTYIYMYIWYNSNRILFWAKWGSFGRKSKIF